MEEATQNLSRQTRSLALSVLDDGRNWHSGLSYIFSNPEFEDIQVCSKLFSFLEEDQRMHDLYFGHTPPSPLEVIFGEELGWPAFEPVGIATAYFQMNGRQGALSVVGPTRLAYDRIIPILRYYGNLFNELGI